MKNTIALFLLVTCALPVQAQPNIARRFISEVKAAYVTTFYILTYPLRKMLGLRQSAQTSHNPDVVVPQKPSLTLYRNSKTIHLSAREALKQTEADCGARSAANCHVIAEWVRSGKPMTELGKELLNEGKVNALVRTIKHEISRHIEVLDDSKGGIWYDEMQEALALKTATKRFGYVMLHDHLDQSFRFRTTNGDYIAPSTCMLHLQRDGIHHVVLCEDNHYRALVIHRKGNDVHYYYADSLLPQPFWNLKTVKKLLSWVEGIETID
jgi:hypothetical protein